MTRLLLLVSLALLLFGAAMYVADIGPSHWLWIAVMTVGAGLRPGSWSPTGFHPDSAGSPPPPTRRSPSLR
jgi:hypothetical protein